MKIYLRVIYIMSTTEASSGFSDLFKSVQEGAAGVASTVKEGAASLVATKSPQELEAERLAEEARLAEAKKEEVQVPSTILKIDPADLEAVQAFLKSKNVQHEII